jgi:hypothetical protein
MLAAQVANIGYFNGTILYDLHMFTHLAPQFTMSDYALGYAGLIGAVVGCQKLKPTPIVPSVAQEVQSFPQNNAPSPYQPGPPANGPGQ